MSQLRNNLFQTAGMEYETVAASQTDQVIGATGGTGDYLHSLVISVNTVATATVSIKDGSTSIPILTGSATLVPGVFSLPLGLYSTSGSWKVTTGAGATVIAVGNFT